MEFGMIKYYNMIAVFLPSVRFKFNTSFIDDKLCGSNENSEITTSQN